MLVRAHIYNRLLIDGEVSLVIPFCVSIGFLFSIFYLLFSIFYLLFPIFYFLLI